MKFYGYWGDSCTLYLLTEYIEGGDLGKLIGPPPGGIGPQAEQKSPLGELTIKAIAKQVLEGTVTMHLMDIIHRDLSPPVGYSFSPLMRSLQHNRVHCY